MTTSRTALREELTAKLLPELRARGFEGPRAIKGNALLHDFRRPYGPVTHTISLQLEKHGLPRFMLNLAIEPPEGFEALIKNGGVVLNGRVRPSPGVTTRNWFRSDLTFWQKLFGAADEPQISAVDACIAILPEIDAWWSSQSPTAHIAVDSTRFPGMANVGRA